MSTTFTRVADSTYEDWQQIAAAVGERQRALGERVRGMLAGLADVTDEFPVNQLEHALQTAARAEADGAGEELVVAALCHDIGKAISVTGHGGIAAAILRPFVRPEVTWVVSVHEQYQGAHYYHHLGLDRHVRNQYVDNPSHELALRFVDEWDERAFDPSASVPGLEHYANALASVFGRERHR